LLKTMNLNQKGDSHKPTPKMLANEFEKHRAKPKRHKDDVGSRDMEDIDYILNRIPIKKRRRRHGPGSDYEKNRSSRSTPSYEHFENYRRRGKVGKNMRSANQKERLSKEKKSDSKQTTKLERMTEEKAVTICNEYDGLPVMGTQSDENLQSLSLKQENVKNSPHTELTTIQTENSDSCEQETQMSLTENKDNRQSTPTQ
uniref:Storkhead-box protein 1 n=1 Tax=Anisakis simplex TaxID=6269 RepID=A0A0M3K4M3_ANISI